MTVRLYYADSYLTTFSASVVARAEGGRRVYLDRTAFYPTSGGQQYDVGVLGGVNVVDVIDEDDRIAHLIETPLDADTVDGSVDWPRRFDHMQQHTAQHIISAVLSDRFGFPTTSVHFGAESSTLDIETGALAPEQIREAEALANAAVEGNLAVVVSFEDAATIEGLRKTSGRSGDLRIVTIVGVDKSACGGTHVRATGEIGPILLRKVERTKKQVRVEFLAGRRALRRARTDYDLLASRAGEASAAIEELPAVFARHRTELKALDSARRGTEELLHQLQARDLYHTSAPDAAGLRRIVHRIPQGSVESLRGLALAVSAHPKAIFLGILEDPPTIVLSSSTDSEFDAGGTLKAGLALHGGRGGGSPRVAQGTIPDRAGLEAASRDLLPPT